MVLHKREAWEVFAFHHLTTYRNHPSQSYPLITAEGEEKSAAVLVLSPRQLVVSEVCFLHSTID